MLRITRIAACIFVCVLSLFAQTVTSIVTGSVVDGTGASVVGASVGLRNEATGDRRESRTDSQGDFVFPAVAPGRYTVSVEAQGFKRLEKTNLNATASDRLAVGKLTLEVGALTESVSVTAQGTSVQTDSQERSAVLTTRQMETLMSRSREYLSLLRVLPGVSYGNSTEQDAMSRSLGPTIQGVRNGFNSMSVDGLPGNDLGSPEYLGSPMNMDAISEVKVLLNNYQAEYGRNAGAVINAVTKSGTTAFHGSGYLYKRHEELNANTYFNNLNGVAKPRYRFATGGYTIGGPIFVPGKFNSAKDKLFFFFSQEIIRSESPQPLRQVTVPTDLERAGNFSQTLEQNGTPVRITDPTTGQAFPNNIIPSNRINLNGQKLLSAFPLPNALDRNLTRGNYNYNFQESLFSPKHQEVFRIDYNASSKLRMYFRGTKWHEDDQGYAVAAGAANWGMLPGHYKYTDDAGVLNATYIFSPTVVNEFQFAAHHNTENGPPRSQEDIDKLNRTKLGMTLPQFYPANNPYNLIPWASFGGITGAAAFSTDARFPVRGADAVFTVSDGINKIWGAHNSKIGIYIERVRNYEGERGTFAGSFDFARDTNNPLDSNWAYSNALLGNFRSYTESDTRPAVQTRGTTVEWYVQDNWKITRRLTLDYGVRFTWYQPLHQADGRAATFAVDRYNPQERVSLYGPALDAAGRRVGRNPVTGELVPAVLIGGIVPGIGNPVSGLVTATDSNYPLGFMDNPGARVGPRFGFAWDVFGDGKMAIRGGGGLFYNPRERGGLNSNLVTNPPIQFSPTIYYGNFDTLTSSTGTLFPSTLTGLARGGQTPTVYSYSFGVQRDVGFGTVIDVAYVASLGRHLFQRRDLNVIPYGARFLAANRDPTTGLALPDNFMRPIPGYGSVGYLEPASNSSYHSLQVQANRRFSRGLQFGAAWTWSKAMDYVDGDTSTVSTYISPRVWNYGKAGYDRTHILVMNWTWDVPRASALWNTRAVRFAFDNWQLSGIGSLQSGNPMGLSFTTTDNVDLTGGGDGARVVMLSNPVLPKGEQSVGRFFRTESVGRPAQGTAGNAPKDVFRGPGIHNWDISIFKNFPIRDRARFQFRWELYNAFNHAQFQAVDTAARFDPLGNQVNARFGALTSTGPARVMQGSLRFSF